MSLEKYGSQLCWHRPSFGGTSPARLSAQLHTLGCVASAVCSEMSLFLYSTQSRTCITLLSRHRRKNQLLPVAAGTALWCELVFVTNPVIQLNFPSSGWKAWTCSIMDSHFMASKALSITQKS